MASAGPSGAPPEASAPEISDLVEGLARARSNQDQTRLAGQGLQRLLRARVSVSTAGTFRAELRELVASALLVPRSHHPPRSDPSDGQSLPGSRRAAGSLLISGGPRCQTPSYLLWRASPFSSSEIETADAIALTVIALHLRWAATDVPSPVRAVPEPAAEPCGLGLTKRETLILEHLAEGLSADAIGSVVGISPRTVRKHLQHVYAKLGAHDRMVAVDTARAAGLLGDRRRDLVPR